MRAFFGLVVCGAIGVGVTLFTRARPFEEVRGLVWGTVADAIRWYKGADGVEQESDWATATALKGTVDAVQGRGQLAVVELTAPLAEALNGAGVGDLVYISDRRAWLGGLRSGQAIVGSVVDGEAPAVRLGPALWEAVVAPGRDEVPLRVRKLY